jgi:hypothetical protein
MRLSECPLLPLVRQQEVLHYQSNHKQDQIYKQCFQVFLVMDEDKQP